MTAEPPSTPAPEPGDQYVQSLVRGLGVIRAFDAENPRMTLSEVASRVSLTRATARRFLLTLVEIGYVQTDGRLFWLTPRVLELGFSYLSALSLPEIAQPFLEELSRSTGESSSASVLDGDDIVYVARVAVRRIMSVSITVGTRFPAYATSMGRVLLAGLDPDELSRRLEAAPVPARTAHTLTDRQALLDEIARVRADGYSLVDQELEVGLRSIAVPIVGARGPAAAVNVSVSASAFSVAEMTSDLLPALVGTATAIGRATLAL